MKPQNPIRLPPFDADSKLLNVIVETPRNGRVKYKYNEECNMFQFGKTLRYGFSFPFEFGFVPSTIGGDGDPLDALVLAQILGVLEGEQSQGNGRNRNDRVVVIPVNLQDRKPVVPTRALDKALISDITKFFVAYNQTQGNSNPLGLAGASVPWSYSKKRAKERPPRNDRSANQIACRYDSGRQGELGCVDIVLSTE
jgi:inorganic pyrophosphatase